MRWLAIVVWIAMAGSILAEGPSLKAPPEPTNMKSIFNRINLFDWQGDPRLWTVKDGLIRGETTPEYPLKGNSFLYYTTALVKNFELRLSFRVSPKNSSGIQYRSVRVNDATVTNRFTIRGYQYELRNENVLPNVSGFLYDEGGKRGRMGMVGEVASLEKNGKKIVKNTIMNADQFKQLMRIEKGAWNDVVIIAIGNNMKHYLNDSLVLDFTDNSPLAASQGLLALQLSTGPAMWVEFKNPRLLELSEAEIKARTTDPGPPPESEAK